MKHFGLIDYYEPRRIISTNDLPSLPPVTYKPRMPVVNTASISNGLVLALPFYEGSGTSIADKSASPLTGTLTNSSLWATDETYGNVLNFDGSNYGMVPNDAKHNIETYTVAFAFKTPTSAYCVPLMKGPNSKFTFSAFLNDYGGVGAMSLEIFTGSSNVHTETSMPYNDNAWHKCVMTRSQGSALRIYIDGVRRAGGADTTGAGATLNTAALYLGIQGDLNYPYTGSLAYVHEWSRVLTGDPGSNGDTATDEIAAITTDEFLMYR